MPKPMIKTADLKKADANSVLSLTASKPQKQAVTRETQIRVDRLLRKTRSKKYMDVMQTLDAGGHTHNRKQIDDILDAIREEFPEVELGGVLLGIVAKCYLGIPYEVHSLEVTGGIAEHYEQGRAMPNGLEKARSIAIHGGYAFIEVYMDCCRAVSPNGTVAVIKE